MDEKRRVNRKSVILRISLVLLSVFSSLFVGLKATQAAAPLTAGFRMGSASAPGKREIVSNASGDNIVLQGVSLTNGNFQASLSVVQDPANPVTVYPIYCYAKDSGGNETQGACGNVVFPDPVAAVTQRGSAFNLRWRNPSASNGANLTITQAGASSSLVEQTFTASDLSTTCSSAGICTYAVDTAGFAADQG